MSEFSVSGRFQTRSGYQEFDTRLDAQNENVAREHVLSRFGSQHGLKRTQIELSEVRSTSDSRTQSDDNEVSEA